MQLELHSLVGHRRGDTVELPLQDHLLLPLAGLDRLEQFIGRHQNMTRAAGRIDQGEFFGVELFRRNRRQLGFHFIRLLSGLDVVLHLALDR